MKKIYISIMVFAVMCTAVLLAEEYSLSEYLTRVERNNPDLLVMFKDIELAKSDVSLARSAFLPRAGVQGTYNRNLIERTQSMAVASAGPGPLIFQDVRNNFDNELILGVGVSQVLYSAGAFTSYNKAKLGQAIREQSYEAARLAFLNAAKKLYARSQLTALVVEIRESSEKFSYEQYQRVERRHQVGAATEMDLLSAEVNWMTKVDAAREAKKNAELVLLAFRDLGGIPHSQPIGLTEIHTHMPDVPQAPDLGSILVNRADYRAILLSRDLTDIDRKAARNAFFPEVTASFSYGLVGMGNGSSFAGDYNFNTASVGISVYIPILTGGARLARMKSAAQQQEKAMLALSQRETAIESELMEILLRLDDAHQRRESSYRTVETARRAVALAESAYINGQATYLTVTDAQDKLDLVWLNFANIGFEYLSAYYDWELAAGIR